MKKYFISALILLFSPYSFAQQETLSSITQSLMQKALTDNPDSQNNLPSLNTLNVPEPKTPEINETKEDKSNTTSTNNDLQKQEVIEAQITTSEQSFFIGKAYIKPFSITVSTEYKSKKFIKQLNFTDISTISCLEWNAFVLDKASNAFQFICQSYLITDIYNNNYKYYYVIPQISKILFETTYGKTFFYSYFIDYLKESQWENLKIKSQITTVYKPIDGVIKAIKFLHKISEDPSAKKATPPSPSSEKKSVHSKQSKPPKKSKKQNKKRISHPQPVKKEAKQEKTIPEKKPEITIKENEEKDNKISEDIGKKDEKKSIHSRR